jgi:hypothetical protein
MVKNNTLNKMQFLPLIFSKFSNPLVLIQKKIARQYTLAGRSVGGTSEPV